LDSPLANAKNIKQHRALVPDNESYVVVSADGTWGRAWDVTVAKSIVEGRQPESVPIEPVREAMEHECLSRVDDPTYALSDAVDVSVPVLVVPFVGGDAGAEHLIDGWKRFYKAMHTGHEYVLAHFLTEEEEQVCRLLDWEY
jgi:hypothetical protein